MTLNQTRAAAVTMDRVVALDPKPDYLYNAGVLWLHAGQPEKALQHLQPLCGRSPAKADWFVALAHAWLARKALVEAAQAMERAAALSRDPEHAYQAGLIWLQARKAEEALRLLIPLCSRSHPRADWLAALSNAYVLSGDMANGAAAMEKAARISGKEEYFFRAARLWLEAERPKDALPLLKSLVERPSPQGEWYGALSNCYLMLEEMEAAAAAMEQGARITKKGEDYYRAGMLWLEAGQSVKGVALLRICVRKAPVEQKWLVSLARALVDGEKKGDALAVMERTDLTRPEVATHIRYQGAVLWLHLDRPGKALPVLNVLCASRDPAPNWLTSLVKTHVALKQMGAAETVLKRLIDHYPEDPATWRLTVWVKIRQADYGEAAAAMAIAVRLGTPDPDALKELSDLYRMAGVPVKAAMVLRETWKEKPTAEDWDRLTNIYLGGHRYLMALASARSAAKAGESSRRWGKVGDIAFRLRRFEESYDAYCRAAALSPDVNIRLKAGYAALKMDRYEKAARFFKEALRQAGKNSRAAREANRNLAFINKVGAPFLQEN